MTERDKKLLVVFAVVVAVGILGLWLPKARMAVETARLAWQRQRAQLEAERAVVALRPAIARQYEELRGKMPIFPEGRSVDTHWLPIMDNTARANNVNIAQRAIGGEENLGDVTELTLECRDWQGRLDSLVWFLYDLENRDDAMMDVRAITIRPSTKDPGVLQGTFTLNCAYMRQPAD